MLQLKSLTLFLSPFSSPKTFPSFSPFITYLHFKCFISSHFHNPAPVRFCNSAEGKPVFSWRGVRGQSAVFIQTDWRFALTSAPYASITSVPAGRLRAILPVLHVAIVCSLLPPGAVFLISTHTLGVILLHWKQN